MPRKPEISKCRVTAYTSGSPYSVAMMSIDMRVGMLPIARLSGTTATSTVVRPLASDVLAAMKTRQQARLAGRTDTDVVVNAEDGFGRSLTFTGFLSAPVMDISRSFVSDRIAVLGADALIDGLDLSIYIPGLEAMRAEADGGPMAAAYSAVEEGDVIKALKEVTTVLMSDDSYQKALTEADTQSMKSLITRQHELNKGRPSEIWLGILDASDVVFDSWSKAMAEAEHQETIRNNIANQIGMMLIQKDSGFWNTIQRVSQALQMIYVPSPDGRGRFVRTDSRAMGNTTDIDLSGAQISLVDGSQRIMQPGGVVMVAAGIDRMRKESVSGNAIAAQYPDPLLSGYIHRDAVPMWLFDKYGTLLFSRDEPPPDDGLNLNLDDLKDRMESTEKTGVKSEDAMTVMLNELCEVIYNDIRLADSTATVVSPLSFAHEPGDRVSANLGNNLTITGFLSSVSHSVAINGKEFSGTTSYELTHVEY